MKIQINKNVINSIQNFYMNVARKYKNTFDYSDMHRNSDMAIESYLQNRKRFIGKNSNHTKMERLLHGT